MFWVIWERHTVLKKAVSSFTGDKIFGGKEDEFTKNVYEWLQ